MFLITTDPVLLTIIMLVDSLTSPRTKPAPLPFTTWLFPLMITVPFPVMEIGLVVLITIPFSLYTPSSITTIPDPVSAPASSTAWAIVKTGDSSEPLFTSLPDVDTYIISATGWGASTTVILIGTIALPATA